MYVYIINESENPETCICFLMFPVHEESEVDLTF